MGCPAPIATTSQLRLCHTLQACVSAIFCFGPIRCIPSCWGAADRITWSPTGAGTTRATSFACGSMLRQDISAIVIRCRRQRVRRTSWSLRLTCCADTLTGCGATAKWLCSHQCEELRCNTRTVKLGYRRHCAQRCLRAKSRLSPWWTTCRLTRFARARRLIYYGKECHCR